MDDVVSDFLVESSEGLARLDEAFLVLERDPHAREVIADVFRTIHTIKGTCGFLGLFKLERLSHSGESLLARLRDGERSFDAEISQALFELVDAVRTILASIEGTGAEGEESYGALIAQLEALAEAGPSAARGPCAADAPQASEVSQAPGPPARAPGARASAPEPAAAQFEAARAGRASVRVDVEHLDRLVNLVGE